MKKASQVKTMLFLILMITLVFVYSTHPIPQVLAADNETQLLVVYYSWTGRARMVTQALKKQLNCEVAEIIPKRPIGIATIVLDQLFDRDNKPKPIAHDLKCYNLVLIVSPIWFYETQLAGTNLYQNNSWTFAAKMST